MRHGVAAACLFILAAGGCSGATREKPGPTVNRTYPIGEFDRLDVAGPYAVNVVTGRAPSVRAWGRAKQLRNLTVVVEGGVLKIRERKVESINFFSPQEREVILQLTVPSIRGADIAGPASVTIDKVAGDQFKGVASGSGDLKLRQADVGLLSLEVAGSGGIVVAGKARRAEYANTGSGDIDAAGVLTTGATVSINGSGDVSAQAKGAVDVDIGGSGEATIGGSPTCIVSKAGPGNVQCG